MKGTTSSCEPGISAATSRAFAVGVRRSCAPDRISVGTAGREDWAGGGGEASGQLAQIDTRLALSAVLASNG